MAEELSVSHEWRRRRMSRMFLVLNRLLVWAITFILHSPTLNYSSAYQGVKI